MTWYNLIQNMFGTHLDQGIDMGNVYSANLPISSTYFPSLDLLVFGIDCAALVLIVWRIFRSDVLTGWQLTFLRAALGILFMALTYQIYSSGARVFFNQMAVVKLRSGWALKDIGIFMLVTSFWLTSRSFRKISAAPVKLNQIVKDDFNDHDMGTPVIGTADRYNRMEPPRKG